MSRYSLKPLPHRADLFEVAVGWDPGLETYFITVFGAPEAQREPEVRLWRGKVWRDLVTTPELEEIAGQYAEVPADLATRLEQDRRAVPHEPRLPINQVIWELLGRVPGK